MIVNPVYQHEYLVNLRECLNQYFIMSIINSTAELREIRVLFEMGYSDKYKLRRWMMRVKFNNSTTVVRR